MQTFLAFPIPAITPGHYSAPSIAHPTPTLPPVPAQNPPFPSHLSGRTYGTHFAGDIEEPPVRPPSAVAPPCSPLLAVSPVSSCSTRLATWPALKTPTPAQCQARPVARSSTRALAAGSSVRGDGRRPPRVQHRARLAAPRPRRPNKAGGGAGRGGVGASASGPLPSSAGRSRAAGV